MSTPHVLVDEPFIPAAYRPPVGDELAHEAWAVARRLIELESAVAPARHRGARPHRSTTTPGPTGDGSPPVGEGSA